MHNFGETYKFFNFKRAVHDEYLIIAIISAINSAAFTKVNTAADISISIYCLLG